MIISIKKIQFLDTVKETGEGRDGNFVFHDGYQGKNRIDFDMCDFAGNCSKYSDKNKAKIWIDTIDPVCKNSISYDGTLSSAAKGKWLGLKSDMKTKETATVTGNCTDPGYPDEKGSGCTGPIIKHTYNYEIKTTVAGPDGNNRGGIYYDVAGNHTTCPTDQTVKIDYTLPRCYNTKTTSSPETSYGWLGIGKTATISAHCTDVASSVTNSGCSTADFSYKYNFEIDTRSAGAKGNGQGGSVYDNADNVVACPADQRVQIDYTAPTCNLLRQASSGSTFSADDWLGIGESAIVKPKCTDNNGTQNASVKSGCDAAANNFYHLYNYEIKTTRAGARGDGNGGVAYDKAGNGVNCPANITMKIDYHAPGCQVTKKNHGALTNGWLRIGRYATVKAHCTDTGGAFNSGCKTADFSHDYNYDIDTGSAGAKGNGNGGTVTDRADNNSNCPANQTVRVDHTAPGCNVTKTTSKPETADGWLGAQGGRGTATVSASCSDPVVNGARSGCTGTTSFSHKYKSEINTSAAGAKGVNSPGKMYDVAGNVTTCGYKTVRIDYTKPSCVEKRSVMIGTASADGWTGIGEAWQVKISCSENGSVKSGCKTTGVTSLATSYGNANYNKKNGGGCGFNCHYVFKDKAGNEAAPCPSNKVIKTDVNRPTCRMTNWDKRDWHTGGVWGTFKCTDTGGSKLKSCVGHSVNTNCNIY